MFDPLSYAMGIANAAEYTGTIYYPHVSDAGILTWTTNNGAPVPPALDLTPYIDQMYPNADSLTW